MPFLSERRAVFFPLTLSMHPAELLFGTMSLGTRWDRALADRTPDLAECRIEPTVLPDRELIHAISRLSPHQVLHSKGLILACRPGPENLQGDQKNHGKEDFSGYEHIAYHSSVEVVESLQYLIDHNARRIIRDWDEIPEIQSPEFYREGKTNPNKGIFIDDRQGPVLLAPEVTILPGARIMGPVVLMQGSVAKMGAELYPGSTFGPFSVVSGEIKNSIIHACSAKGHAGYLGDSVMGRWNNFGAGTTISNVSHTFSKVRITEWSTGAEMEYDTIKRGLMTGDFVKLGIGSQVFRGTAIGSFSSLSTNQFISGNIPPFTWWASGRKSAYQIDALREHNQRQMALRGREWNDRWENALQFLSEDPIADPVNRSE